MKKTFFKVLYSSFYFALVTISLFSCKKQTSQDTTDNPTKMENDNKSTPMSTYQVNKIKQANTDVPWESAIVLKNFSYPWEEDVHPSLSFRALYDDDKFYFKYEVEDSRVLTYVDTNDKM